MTAARDDAKGRVNGSNGHEGLEPLSHAPLAPTKFKGQISSDELSIPLIFEASVDQSGKLRLIFEDIIFDGPSARSLYDVFHGDKVRWLVLTGTSDAGEEFTSRHFGLTSVGTKTSDTANFISIAGTCEKADITLQTDSPNAVGMRFGLRGIDLLSTPLKVSMFEHGTFDIHVPLRLERDDYDRITGAAQITAPTNAAPDPEWYRRTENMGEDILLALSVAKGVNLLPRLIWVFRPEYKLKLQIRGRPDVTQRGLEGISDYSYQNYLAAILNILINEPLRFEEIRFALEWMNVPCSHSEVRLFASATALENLLTKGLTKAERTLLDDEIFGPLKGALKRIIACKVHDAVVRNRLLPQNEIGLRSKIERLMMKWGATKDNLPDNAIRNAVNARNMVTHRGVFEDDSGEGVWPHAMVLREIVFRLIFARIGFVGNYVSHIGGFHDRSFPICAPLTT